MQRTVVLADAVGAAGDQGLFVAGAAAVQAELQGKEPLLSKDKVTFLGELIRHVLSAFLAARVRCAEGKPKQLDSREVPVSYRDAPAGEFLRASEITHVGFAIQKSQAREING